LVLNSLATHLVSPDGANHVLIFTAVIVAAAVFAMALLVQRSWNSTRRVVQGRLVDTEEAAPAINRLFPTLPRLESLSERAQRIQLELEQAGSSVSPMVFTAIRALSAFVFAILGLILAKVLETGVLLDLIFGAGGFLAGFNLPLLYLNSRKARRLALIEDQLVDVLTSMSKSLRAGLGFMQALDYATRETPSPLGPELARVLREVQLGADLETVLEDTNHRIASNDLEIASTAMIIQRRVGGNLSEILGNVANTIRERRQLRQEVHTITSRQRLTGNFSALLPVLVGLLFFAINPTSAQLLFTDTAGKISLMVGIGFELAGLWMIRRFSVVEV
jgi:tight adherence protein B